MIVANGLPKSVLHLRVRELNRDKRLVPEITIDGT